MSADPVHQSPYAISGPRLLSLGYHAIPIVPGEKAPGEYQGGRWIRRSGWQAYRDRSPTDFELRVWCNNYPDAGVGIVLGSSVGPDRVIAIDLDADDYDALEALRRALPPSPMVKKGAKGETRFYRAPPEIKSRPYDNHRLPAGKGRRLADILTGNETKQTVVPPSRHPSGGAYVWLAGPVPATDLPRFTPDDLEVFCETLETLGWNDKASPQEPRRLEPQHTGDDYWSETKAAAMADLRAWVPQLGLYGCRPARGGYEAVATWRPSSTGQPVEKRKRNLSINPAGIRDFGTDDTYSPIDLVMKAMDLDQADATRWLRERLGLDQGGIVIQLPTAAMRREEPAPPPEPAPPREVSELPDSLTRVPGLLGDIVDWIADTAMYPQRALALGAAIAIVGTAAGRKYAGPTRSGTHFYIIALAPSGSGKNHAAKMGQRLMSWAGMQDAIGPSQFKSGSAVIQQVGRHPLLLSFIDEFGNYLGRINNPNNRNGHEREISGALRTLWGASFDTIMPAAWADSSASSMKPVHAPALSIYGMSVHEEFFEAIQGADLSNGFLNRFMLFSTFQQVEEVEPRLDEFEPPQALIQRLTAIAQASMTRNVLAAATAHHAGPTAPDFILGWGDGAKEVYGDLKRALRDRPEAEKLLKRTHEIAIRLATVRAIGCGSMTISRADMEWGRDVAMWSAERMIADVSDYMVESEHQGRAKMVLRLIRDAPGGSMTRTELCRRVNHRFDARVLGLILDGLIDSGQVHKASPPREGRGRPSETYTYLGG